MKSWLYLATTLMGVALATAARADDYHDWPDHPRDHHDRDHQTWDQHHWGPRWDHNWGYHDWPSESGPPPSSGRSKFVYAPYNGSWRRLSDGTWVDSSSIGTWYFHEVRRTPAYIELYDPRLKDTVRLYDHEAYQRYDWQSTWQPAYAGYWAQ